ncbi:MAG TPA: hypothetical protein VIS10_02265, partial [Anaerolineales bacterium]
MMVTRYISFIKLGLPLLLAGLLLALIVGTGLSAQVELLNDGFEPPNPEFANWDGNGTTSWQATTSAFRTDSRSARASNNHEGNLTSDNLDASDAVSIKVDFWISKTLTTDTGFTLFYYDGTAYDLITELDGLGGDDAWLHYTHTITDT